MNDDDDEKRGSPRARARAHLRRMLTASLVAVAGCGDDGTTASSDPCAPDGCDPLPPPTTSDTGDDSATSSTGQADSTTWDDPCAEDGCDPPPPPGTSTGASSSGTEGDTSSSGGSGSGSSSGGSSTGG